MSTLHLSWISVTDRLPEDMDKVLVYTKWPIEYLQIVPQKCEIRFGYYNKKLEIWEILHNIYNIEVTHWMPLPSPPEEK